MEKMAPIPQTLVQQLVSMKVGDHKVFMDNPAHSVRALISRMRSDPDKKRKAMGWITRLADDRVHAEVWRIK